ncbi:MAG TPA: peptide MFS transporter [Longimicrobiales bacterium]
MARETSSVSGSGAPVTAPSAAAVAPAERTFLGHPRGLSTLFFTEMWERFSYYGMRALLALFMTTAAVGANPGLGFSEATMGAVYGLYTSMVYLLTLPGGWIADNLWGQRKAVFVGGCIIALGHFTLAAPLVGAPDVPSFFLGLLFVAVGTGLLKANVSTMVGDLYPPPGEAATEKERQEWAAKRDSAFSIFYMGINIGAMLGPFICSTLGEGFDWGFLRYEGSWHLGFSLAGFGMVLGLIQYKRGDRYLGSAGYLKTNDPEHVLRRRARNFYVTTAAVVAAAALMVYLLVSGALGITLTDFAAWVGYGILLVALLFFTYLIFDVWWAAGLLALFGVSTFLVPGQGTAAGQQAIGVTLGAFVLMNLVLLLVRRGGVSVEKKRLMVAFWLFLLAATFWAGFEQAGSSMNLFARDLTDRTLFGWEIPAGWLQNVNPFFIIVLAPVFGVLWTWLAHRNRNPSIPMKFALGVLGLAAGMFVLAWGASYASATNRVSMAWLVTTYFLFTVGELALSPVGLSSMTKLAPPGRLGQMMGVWFIASALGNLFAGLVAGSLETLSPSELFMRIGLVAAAVGALALVLSPVVNRLTGGIR